MSENWSTGKSSQTGDTSSLFPKSQLPKTPSHNSENASAITKKASLLPPEPSGEGKQPKFLQPKQRQWWHNWMLWLALAGLFSSSVGFLAVTMLLKLPSAPNCPMIFWPLASASVRLHCAQVAANKQTVADLLRAIALVQALPKSHALRPEVNRYLEQWSSDILTLAEDTFQAGELQKAIAIARKIPSDVPAYQAVEQQIKDWQSIWSEAEATYAEAEAKLPEQKWHQAFMTSVRLLNLGNNYWATTKYAELNDLIDTAREDATKLTKAQDLVDSGSLENLLAALKIADSFGRSSYSYQKAQELIPEVGRQMLDLAQAALDRQDADAAIEIANQIPASTGLQPEAQDLVALAEAWRSAWVGTVPNLEAAIASVERIGADRPLYNQAQELITRWQLEIEDIAHLERARELAQMGTVGDLTAAIAEASLIPDSNPRATEAQREINSWRRQVETIEDQPYLDRAQELAITEEVPALQAAINEVSQITRGRALYPEASRKVRTWTRKIQRIQDQPYLDQARELASIGNLPAAISMARQISSGRALHSEAQTAVRDWEGQIQARQNWRDARRIAFQGTPEALAQAIRLANRVPVNNPLRFDVNPAIDQWGQQLLNFAQQRSQSDVPGAIRLAERIPRSSSAYRAAQEQIAAWQRFLNPPSEPDNPESDQTNNRLQLLLEERPR